VHLLFILKLKFEVTKWIENNYGTTFTLENNYNYESTILVREQDTKEYSKRINEYVRKKVIEANSLMFNNFGK